MTLKLLVLFFTPLLAGLVVYLVPSPKGTNFKLVLVFAGAYLFAITVTHILPDLYREHGDMALIGLFVLAGFFLQQLLEYFTSGIEHGHIHTHDHNHEHHHHHTHHQASALVLLVALCVHAFLEGSMLAQPEVMGIGYSVNAVLLGIALHRAPAAFALMTVLASQLHSKAKAIPHLIIFSLAAPIGLLVSSYFAESKVITETGMIYLYALVSGNFLHISTTIVFESSPEHRFNAKKLAVAIAGALLAIAVEYVI
ncbi:MAG TPA: ZIP family metal transporter [Cyclobacteriaceae bacterium]|jgi:zinc transporter ZupT|nr:ZIP family metal transporter [Cytophagales bacterium]HRE67800.1 ZIP family metal transporter [Cyclobacteriaceae bacterium]HRF34601.1 ZIP family metal transporter [Cyclobacteriaceae bacterium]